MSPHPRNDVKALRAAMPATWSVWEGRTLELLRRGPAAVVQRSSGVALEALQLGVPVVELSFPGDTPVYPFIREPFVHVAADAERLRERLRACRDTDPSRRSELVEWARHWVAAAGPDAVSRATAVVERAKGRGPLGPIWDTWG